MKAKPAATPSNTDKPHGSSARACRYSTRCMTVRGNGFEYRSKHQARTRRQAPTRLAKVRARRPPAAAASAASCPGAWRVASTTGPPASRINETSSTFQRARSSSSASARAAGPAAEAMRASVRRRNRLGRAAGRQAASATRTSSAITTCSARWRFAAAFSRVSWIMTPASKYSNLLRWAASGAATPAAKGGDPRPMLARGHEPWQHLIDGPTGILERAITQAAEHARTRRPRRHERVLQCRRHLPKGLLHRPRIHLGPRRGKRAHNTRPTIRRRRMRIEDGEQIHGNAGGHRHPGAARANGRKAWRKRDALRSPPG